MGEKLEDITKDDFHAINNLLNKITTQAGMTRYHLEEKGINLEKIEEEKGRLIRILDGMEENAMAIGQMLKKLRKSIG